MQNKFLSFVVICFVFFACTVKNNSPYITLQAKDTVKTDSIPVPKNQYPYTDTFRGTLAVSFLDYTATKHDTDTAFVFYASHTDSTNIIFTCNKEIDLCQGYKVTFMDSVISNQSGVYLGSLKKYDSRHKYWISWNEPVTLTIKDKSLIVNWDIARMDLTSACAEWGEDIGLFKSR